MSLLLSRRFITSLVLVLKFHPKQATGHGKASHVLAIAFRRFVIFVKGSAKFASAALYCASQVASSASVLASWNGPEFQDFALHTLLAAKLCSPSPVHMGRYLEPNGVTD